MAQIDVLLVCEAGKGQTESINGRLIATGLELAGRWGGRTIGMVAGHGVSAYAKDLARYLDAVYVADAAQYAQYTGPGHLHALSRLFEQLKPGAVLFGHSYLGIDLAPRLGLRLGAGVASNCIALLPEGEGVGFLRPMYRGRLHARVVVDSRPVIATLQGGGVQLSARDSSGELIELDAGDASDPRIRAVKVVEPERTGVDITAADIVVSGGRGVGNKENYVVVSDLAEALGGVSACSRPLVDMGWFESNRQVGLSGNTVKPKLYVACGISGAMEHLHGMKEAGIIAAINQDAGAPIFKVAHLGLVGDLNEIVPQVTAQVKRVKAQSTRG